MLKSIPTAAGQAVHWSSPELRSAMASYLQTRWPCGVLAVVCMWAIKRYYSLATAAQLDWVLAPTARLVAWFTPANPAFESGVGYVDFEWGIIVAPACAGINFMIMAFGLAAFYGLHHMRRWAIQLAWLAMALAGAFSLALIINTGRIAISLSLYQADIYSGWLTAARVHRMTGVGLYFSALWLYYLSLRPIIGRYCRCFDHQPPAGDARPPSWLPLAWYLLGAVGVPVANRMFQHDLAPLGEHCATVILAGFTIWALAMVMGRLVKGKGIIKALCRKGSRAICRSKF